MSRQISNFNLLPFPHLLESSIDFFDASFLLKGEEVQVLVEEHLMILLEISEQFGLVSALSLQCVRLFLHRNDWSINFLEMFCLPPC